MIALQKPRPTRLFFARRAHRSNGCGGAGSRNCVVDRSEFADTPGDEATAVG